MDLRKALEMRQHNSTIVDNDKNWMNLLFMKIWKKLISAIMSLNLGIILNAKLHIYAYKHLHFIMDDLEKPSIVRWQTYFQDSP